MDCPECEGSGKVENVVVAPWKGHRNKIRGWRKTWLLNKLAMSDSSGNALATALGVHHTTVYNFAKKYEDEIQRIRDHMEEEFVTLWITEKVHRLAEYQQDVEDANDVITEGLSRSDREYLPQWIRIKHQALRAVADETGQIPNKISMNVEGDRKITYVLEGVDIDKL